MPLHRKRFLLVFISYRGTKEHDIYIEMKNKIMAMIDALPRISLLDYN
jgi:hypothetical protein